MAELIFVRHPRARRYVIRVRHDGSVRVTMPRWGSRRHAQNFADEQRGWIERQRRRAEQRRQLFPSAESPEMLAALRTAAKTDLPEELQQLAATNGLTVKRITVRNQRSRWGSCSPSGHICLNWRLVLMPDFVREYVMIHELMHLRRLDHSPVFWKLVAAACPRCDEARRWLRAHGTILH